MSCSGITFLLVLLVRRRGGGLVGICGVVGEVRW